MSCKDFIRVSLASDDDRMEKPVGLERCLEHVQAFPIRSDIRWELNVGDLEMFNIKLTFGERGTTFSPGIHFYFRKGTRSRSFGLPGGARIIRRIDFSYRRVVGGARGIATVHVYGRS